jgi:hypothetical protein
VISEREALHRLCSQGRAWFSLAVAMDPKAVNRMEVTKRIVRAVKVMSIKDDRAELDCGGLSFPNLKGGTYDFLAISLTPAGEPEAWLTMGETTVLPAHRGYRLPRRHAGLTIGPGGTITVARIDLILQERE